MEIRFSDMQTTVLGAHTKSVVLYAQREGGVRVRIEAKTKDGRVDTMVVRKGEYGDPIYGLPTIYMDAIVDRIESRL